MILLTSESKLKTCFPKFWTRLFPSYQILLCWCVHLLVEYAFLKQLFIFYTTVVGLWFIPTKSNKNSKRYWTCCIAANTVCTTMLFLTFLLLTFLMDLWSLQHVAGVKWYMINHGGILFRHWSNGSVYWPPHFDENSLIFATCGRWEMIHDLRHGGISFPHWSVKLSQLFDTMIYTIYHNVI